MSNDFCVFLTLFLVIFGWGWAIREFCRQHYFRL